MYTLFRYFSRLVLLSLIILREFLGLLKISCRGWRRCGVIGVSGISAGTSGASGGVAGVELNGVGLVSGVGVDFGVGRLNFDYIESVEESF